MLSHARQFLVLFLSVVILLIGHGLQLTLLPLRADGLGWDVSDIGMTGSFYFLGFMAGCIGIPRFVVAVGHIRTFSTSTTVCGGSLLLILLTDDPVIWAGLRFLTGLGISGCYIIIESWLNEQTEDQYRSRILAIYSILVLAAMTLGQVLVNIGEPTGVIPVVIGSMLLSAAIIPLSLTNVEQPAPQQELRFKLREVYRASHAAVGAAFLTGSITGVLFTLTPVAGTQFGLDLADVSVLMICLVAGGSILQLPAGRLSDSFDRRKVMIALVLIGGVSAVVGVATFDQRLPLFLTMIILGGSATAIYPICLAHANDRYPDHFLEVGTVILMANATGSVLGPILGALAMTTFGAQGFFYFIAAGMLSVLLWLIYCIVLKSKAPVVVSKFVNTTKSSQALLVLDPRADHQESPTGAADTEAS
ncbi:MAG: MFS transporter [Proteobacteria bacterium]|nr:MFS transporter [Pseudomonadota bacterium]